MRISNFFENVL